MSIINQVAGECAVEVVDKVAGKSIINLASKVVNSKVVGKVATHAFPVGRILKLTQAGIRVTNSTSPLGIAKNVSLTIIDCCCPAPVRLAAHCVGLAGLGISFAVAPSPVLGGSFLAMAHEIYDRC